jgi:hypothetical protein
MRIPHSLSFSAFSLFESDLDEYYLKYLADDRPPKLPQTPPMAVGSAFDAEIKAGLHSAVFGPNSDINFTFEKLFEDQVEPHNRDFARGPGRICYDAYKLSGAYDDLLKLLLQSIEPPRFETTLEQPLPNGVPFVGKPDLRFMLQFPGYEPVRVILDFKVKQYCSKSAASPSKGYALCRDGYDGVVRKAHTTKAFPQGKQSSSHASEHKNYMAYDHRGLTINAGHMEHCNDDYAAQVSCYAWQLGETPGDENFVIWIDELCCKPAEPFPLIRVAQHRGRVGKDFQLNLLNRIGKCWESINSGHVFQDMTREENDSRMELLDAMALSLQSDGSSTENWFNEVVRPQFKR